MDSAASTIKIGSAKTVVATVTGGGGYFLVKGYWGCAAGWGRISTTGLTIMGLHF